MRHRKPLKLVSATTNAVTRYTQPKKSVELRTRELLSALGIDEAEYRLKTSLKRYSKLATHQHLGINS